MLPSVSTISAPLPAQPVIVATPIPGSAAALRVPADNVPPTVANVQVSNNSRGGNSAVAMPAPPVTAAAPSSSAGNFIPSFNGTPSTLSLSAQTTFFAQLMSQDASPQTKIVLAQYEKLLQLAQVKYMPSNAGLPQPEPSSLFGRILQQEKQAPRAPVQAASEQAAASSAATQTTVSAATPRPSRPTRSEAPARIDNAPIAKPRAISAYIATVSRNEMSERKPAEVEST